MIAKIGERICDLRKENGYSSNQVADYLKITKKELLDIESGRKGVEMTLAEKICLLYNCSPDYLLGKTDFYEKPKIAFRSGNNINLDIIAKMNETMGYLKLLDEINEEE